MIEFVTTNKEALLGAVVALVVLVGAVVKLTKTSKDDSVFNKIVKAVGLGKYSV